MPRFVWGPRAVPSIRGIAATQGPGLVTSGGTHLQRPGEAPELSGPVSQGPQLQLRRRGASRRASRPSAACERGARDPPTERHLRTAEAPAAGSGKAFGSNGGRHVSSRGSESCNSRGSSPHLRTGGQTGQVSRPGPRGRKRWPGLAWFDPPLRQPPEPCPAALFAGGARNPPGGGEAPSPLQPSPVGTASAARTVGKGKSDCVS